MIYLELFISFFQVGLFCIGGGYAAVPLIQNQIVQARGWLTLKQMADLMTIAEMTPGPIAVNAATFTGVQIAGPLGAVAATAGCIAPSCVLVSLLAVFYVRCRRSPVLDRVLSCLRPAVVAVIASAGLSMLWLAVLPDGGQIDYLSAALFVGAFAALRKFKCNPILVMAACGAVGVGMHLLI